MTTKHRTKLALLATALFCLCIQGSTRAGRKPPLTEVESTAWVFSGSYRVKAKKTGLLDFYSLQFVVDFFSDGTFSLQDLPIEEGQEDDFFSGTWVQDRNKVLLIFDEFSRLILTEIFEEELSIELEAPVDVFIERWEIKSKLRTDRTDFIFMKFKERLRHLAIFDGIPIRIKTRGKGTGDFFEEIEG